jgi:hypothetical protein
MPLDKAAELKARFEIIDTDGSGKLELAELEKAFGEHAQQFLQFCDADEDGMITGDEFVKGIVHDVESTEMPDDEFQVAWLDRLDGVIEEKKLKEARQAFLKQDLERVKEQFEAPNPKFETCKKATLYAVPSWSGLEESLLKVTQLGGDTGTAFKVECGQEGLEPSVVMVKIVPPPSGEYKPGVGETASKVFGADPKEVNFCGINYMSGDASFPGVMVAEFAGGGEVGQGALFNNTEDAASAGRCLALLHHHDQAWYHSQFSMADAELPPPLNQQNDAHKAIPAFAEMVSNEAATEAKYGQLMQFMLSTSALTMPGITGAIESGILDEAIAAGMFPKPGPQLDEATAWYAGLADHYKRILDLVDDEPSLMDKVSLCHGDCHGGQFIHRTTEPGNLMLIDYDFLMPAPAWYDFGPPIFNVFMAQLMQQPVPFPSLENRTAACEAYRAALGDEVVSKYPRNTVEDMLFDSQKGFVGRLLFCCGYNFQGNRLFQNASAPMPYGTWLMTAIADTASKAFKEGRTDDALKKRIVEEGICAITFEKMAAAVGVGSFLEVGMAFAADAPAVAAKISDVPLGPIVGDPQ